MPDTTVSSMPSRAEWTAVVTGADVLAFDSQSLVRPLFLVRRWRMASFKVGAFFFQAMMASAVSMVSFVLRRVQAALALENDQKACFIAGAWLWICEATF